MRGNMYSLLDTMISKAGRGFLNFGAFVAYPVLIVVVLTDILLRTFWNTPLPWGVEVSGLLLIFCFFAPVCVCEEEKTNIALDFLSSHFSPRGKTLVDLFGCAAGALWIGLLCYRNFVEVPEMIRYGETGIEFHYPLWPLRLFLALALLFLFARLCLHVAAAVGKLGKGA